MTPPLTIIPVRIGSTRIPKKNLQPLAGRSPLNRAIEVVSAAVEGETGIVVTTDNRLAVIGQLDQGSRVSIYERRTPGDGPMVSVVQEVLDVYPGPGDQPVLLVQPTQPLREVKHLHQALALLRGGCVSVASVTQTISVDKLYTLDRVAHQRMCSVGAGVERDQDGTPTYRCDGTVYGFRRQWFLEAPPLCAFRHPVETVPFIIPQEETCALDTPHDWYVAGLILADRRRGALS